MRSDHDSIRAVSWEHGALQLLDQRLLPTQEEYLRLDDSAAVAAAIRQMVVRGAPAIGISAGYAAVLAARNRFAESAADWRTGFEQDLAVVHADPLGKDVILQSENGLLGIGPYPTEQ